MPIITAYLFCYAADHKGMIEGEVPVIIGQAPPADSPQRGGFHVFHGDTGPNHDMGGPLKEKPKTPASSTGSRKRPFVVMPSPTKSKKENYKSSEFSELQLLRLQ
jgi:hypothetical protein